MRGYGLQASNCDVVAVKDLTHPTAIGSEDNSRDASDKALLLVCRRGVKQPAFTPPLTPGDQQEWSVHAQAKSVGSGPGSVHAGFVLQAP